MIKPFSLHQLVILCVLSTVLLHASFLYFKVFQGNMERNLVVFHKFRPSLKTRYVRIHPKTWYSYISMRVELYGCRLGKLCF